MNFFVQGCKPEERYAIACVILEGVEHGAGRHCLEQNRNAAGHVIRVSHHRLGVSISFA